MPTKTKHSSLEHSKRDLKAAETLYLAYDGIDDYTLVASSRMLQSSCVRYLRLLLNKHKVTSKKSTTAEELHDILGGKVSSTLHICAKNGVKLRVFDDTAADMYEMDRILWDNESLIRGADAPNKVIVPSEKALKFGIEVMYRVFAESETFVD